jgi:signal transduction histidine kinase
MSIKDDGEGFNLSSKKNGIGFENIRRRVQVLDGQVKIFSAPGDGCEINVQIPFR